MMYEHVAFGVNDLLEHSHTDNLKRLYLDKLLCL